jgi:hypothetical protein
MPLARGILRSLPAEMASGPGIAAATTEACRPRYDDFACEAHAPGANETSDADRNGGQAYEPDCGSAPTKSPFIECKRPPVARGGPRFDMRGDYAPRK